MHSELIAVHPVVSWLRIDAQRLQVRVPTGQHMTFDRHTDVIESLLTSLKTPQTLEELHARFPAIEARSFSELLQFLRFMVIVAPVRPGRVRWLLMDLMDYHARLTEVARTGVPDPFVRQIVVLGEGPLARYTREVIAHEAVAAALGAVGSVLRIACVEREDIALLRRANREAVEAGELVTFVYWTGSHFVVGPLVVPKQSSCFECALVRRAGASKHVDEVRALVETPPESAHPIPHFDPMLEGLVRFAVGRHVSAVTRGLFQAAQPGHVEHWDPVDGSRRVTRVLKLPRCGVCSRHAAVRPPRAVRDFL
jgi:bacteriocin biosynthesis cyclodehydratase domain-containing protein